MTINPTTKTEQEARMQEQDRVEAHKAAGLCSARSHTCKYPAVPGYSHCKADRKRLKARATDADAVARSLYPKIHVVYESLRNPSSHKGQVFSAKRWLLAGGTQKQVNKILAQSDAAGKRKRKTKKKTGVKELTESILTISESKTERKNRTPSKGQRKQAEYLERQLVAEAVAYAESQGVLLLPMDKEGYPDKLATYKGQILGANEFKSPTGTPTKQQKMRILQLREEPGWNEDMVPPPMRLIATFKKWLKGRINAL